MHTSADENFGRLGLKLPPAPTPIGVYKPCLVIDKILFVSGHGPIREDKTLITGVVGKDLTDDEGKQAARQVGLAILATIKSNFQSLDKVKRVIKVLGMVNADPTFKNHPYVINGCSELFAQVWGDDRGVGVRSAVGMGSLPGNIAVEIEVVLEMY